MMPDLLTIAIAEPTPHGVRGAVSRRAAVPRIDRYRHGVRLHNQTVAAGPNVLRLVDLSRAVIRVLRMTGVLGLFDVHDNVEDALAGVDVPCVARSSPP
jgi:hypothetical protein